MDLWWHNTGGRKNYWVANRENQEQDGRHTGTNHKSYFSVGASLCVLQSYKMNKIFKTQLKNFCFSDLHLSIISVINQLNVQNLVL